MTPIKIGKAIIDDQVAEAIADYQVGEGLKFDCETLNTTIDYLFEVSEMQGYVSDMDPEKMLRLLYSLKKTSGRFNEAGSSRRIG